MDFHRSQGRIVSQWMMSQHGEPAHCPQAETSPNGEEQKLGLECVTLSSWHCSLQAFPKYQNLKINANLREILSNSPDERNGREREPIYFAVIPFEL